VYHRLECEGRFWPPVGDRVSELDIASCARRLQRAVNNAGMRPARCPRAVTVELIGDAPTLTKHWPNVTALAAVLMRCDLIRTSTPADFIYNGCRHRRADGEFGFVLHLQDVQSAAAARRPLEPDGKCRAAGER
jgi:hypothetical protein